MRKFADEVRRLSATDPPILGEFYLRAEDELSATQQVSLREHLTRKHYDCAAGAIARAEGARIYAVLHGIRQGGGVGLRRVAASVSVDIGNYPVIANSYSYGNFYKLMLFMTGSGDVEERSATLTAARTRIEREVTSDLYGLASNDQEARGLVAAGLEEVSSKLVRSLPRDVVTELSNGRKHRWFFLEDTEVERRQQLKLRDADRIRDILDRVERTGHASEAEKAELTRIVARLSLGDFWAIEIHRDHASIPKGEPRIPIDLLRKLLEG